MTMRRFALPLALLVAPLSAATVTRVVPIVLDVTTGTARYTTELTLTNDTQDAVTVSALYTPALGSKSGNGTVTDSLGPGEQRRIPDVLSWLRLKGLGLPLPSVGPSQGGTLKLDFTGPSAEPARIWALARTGSDTRPPQPAGRAGTAYAAFLLGEAAPSAWVYAVSNELDRTNLAIVNASEVLVTFDVDVQDLSGRGVLSYNVARGVKLDAWGWTQIDSPALLEASGSRAGRVTVTADGPVYVYAVVNDRITNDGSFVVADSPVRDGSDGFTVAVETPGFLTEAALFSSGSPFYLSAVNLAYADSLGPVPGAGATATIPPPYYGVEFVPNVIDRLRASAGSTLGTAAMGPYGGILEVTHALGGGSLVRTVARSPAGGRFGVFVPSVALSDAATDHAAVYGLVADDKNRTNVAAFSPGGNVTLRLDVHDGLAGGIVQGAPVTISLGPLEWRQVNGILRSAGVTEGWVEVTRTSGTAGWFAYGIVNDGAYPGERTGDGAYVPGIPQNLNTSCPAITVFPLTIPEGTVTLEYVGVIFSSIGGLGGWTLTGALPAGMTFNPLGVKGNFNIWLPTLSGTPVQAGTFPFIVTVTDANGCTGSRSYALVIAGLSGASVDRDEVVPNRPEGLAAVLTTRLSPTPQAPPST